MAKKQENKLSYLQMPLPEGRKSYRMVKRAWQGLNYKQTIDSGALSMEKNISTLEAPYLVPSQKYKGIGVEYPSIVGFYGFDDFLLVIYQADFNKTEGSGTKTYYATYVDYIKLKKDGSVEDTYTGIVSMDASEQLAGQRCVVQFNKYLESKDIINGEYTKRLLFFPDKASMFMYIVKSETDPAGWDNAESREADRTVMYCYTDNKDNKTYYTVGTKKGMAAATEQSDTEAANTDPSEWSDDEVEKADATKVYCYTDNDGDKHYYKVGLIPAMVQSGVMNHFYCDGMDVTIKEYYNDKPKKDEDDKVIEPKEYPPPESADTNCYYRNTYKCPETLNGEAVFKYVQYDTVDEDGKKDGGTDYGWKISVPPSFPNIKYATVHSSRLFGVSDDSVYVSGFNDYTNWNLDSVDAYNESNAWCSKAQSNTKADGDFTGIVNFQGHVVCFKRDFMHEIYNTKNPFRIQDIFAEGTIDHRTIQEVDGRLIFVSEDDVKVYTGSNPRILSHNLNISHYRDVVSGTDGRCYYLSCPDKDYYPRLYVYDTYTEQWSEQEAPGQISGFAYNKTGMYMLCGYKVHKLDTGLYDHNWGFETDLITNQTVNIKHLKKMQMLIEVPEWVKEPNEYDKDGIENTDAGIKVYLLYDNERYEDLSSGILESRLVYKGEGYGRKAIRIKTRNTANYGLKLHVDGRGYVKIYEMELIMESGGDLYV